MKRLITLLSFFVLTSFCVSTENADSILGVWQNGTGKGHIEIFKQNGRYHGKIVWLRDAIDKRTGKPKTDFKNEDPSQHQKPLMGLMMLRDFKYDGGEWTDGRIYNPGDGRQYKAYIKMKDAKTLMVRGYMGISLLGKTDLWTRVK
jgi:uncharacterized protein (DUF2147 family)